MGLFNSGPCGLFGQLRGSYIHAYLTIALSGLPAIIIFHVSKIPTNLLTSIGLVSAELTRTLCVKCCLHYLFGSFHVKNPVVVHYKMRDLNFHVQGDSVCRWNVIIRFKFLDRI